VKALNNQTANTEAIAKELREVDLGVTSSDDVPLDDTLKQQYQKNMLERYPDFEAQTASDGDANNYSKQLMKKDRCHVKKQ